ncbi:hypothetical protein [Actinomadura rubrisoli]|uniref:Uncharacterized protein n=1 Tax=Actinomadura rubrisoli TaxID=2530368 RepID=A0A4R5B2D9_9ACTN|nr:hypothetical protein [Actinomadura rubrisoli]TDD79315.1 hypothetical protein E1298_28020 [Actinomadura rubrisoli]
MGVRSRWIADLDAHPGDAPEIARSVLRWLVGAGVIVSERTDCVLGDVPGGYAPGPSCKTIVTGDPSGFPDVWPNGLEIDVGRSAFYGAVDEDDRVTCPRCGAWLPFEIVLTEVEEWLEGGPDSLVCARCGTRTGLNGWRWPVPCAFAELGLRFWNWPELTDAFVSDLGGRIGHRLVTGSFAT